MADGFLNRWSRRKSGLEAEREADALQSRTEAGKVVPPKEPLGDSATTVSKEAPVVDEPAAPTIEDAEKMDRFAPDFSAFMKPNVDPVVQQAAMKRLFSDPHFNIMDRLDIYIDDYSIPDPIPMEMLKRMVQSHSLGLFKKPEEEQPADQPLQAQTPEVPQQDPEVIDSKIGQEGGEVLLPEQSLASLENPSKKKIPE